jgi:phage repressor protein C with HTH and peptisase S24 domain
MVTQLNTMFIPLSNTTCNNILFTYANIRRMTDRSTHPTAARLLEAAKLLKGCDGPSDVARLLGVSPQKITNWKARGVSREGMLDAERLIGVSAIWLQTGDGEMTSFKAKHSVAVDDLSKKSHSVDMFNESAGETATSLDDRDLPQPTEEEFAYVPQLDMAAACGDGRFEDHVVVKGGLAFKRSSLRDFGVPEKSARIIYSAGGSMAPTIQDGRVVLLNLADTTPLEAKIYAICMPDGGLVLKRLIRDYHPAAGAVVWIMRSDNPDKTQFADKILPPDDRTMIAGRAVWTDSLL